METIGTITNNGGYFFFVVAEMLLPMFVEEVFGAVQ